MPPTKPPTTPLTTLYLLCKPPSSTTSKTRLHPYIPPPSNVPISLLCDCLLNHTAKIDGKSIWGRRIVAVTANADEDTVVAAAVKETIQKYVASTMPDSFDITEGWEWTTVNKGDNGDLGVPLTNLLLRSIEDGGVVFVGMDSPNIPLSLMSECQSALTSGSNYVVPAEDGGYTMLGIRSGYEGDGPFSDGIRWSTGDTLDDQVRVIERDGERIIKGRTWYDVDEVSDLFRLVSDIKKESSSNGKFVKEVMMEERIWDIDNEEGFKNWMGVRGEEVKARGGKRRKLLPSKPPRSILRVVGSGITLVPYLKSHVERYNGWMKDPYLLSTTASEPLTLEEEYEMQEEWRVSRDKHTFIILEGEEEGEEGNLERMVGDVNMFVSVEEEIDDDGKIVHEIVQGELEVMIAEAKARRKGYGLVAIRCMIEWGRRMGVERMFVKIGDGNDASKGLFEKKLGFKLVKYVEVFKETEYEITEVEDFEKAMGDLKFDVIPFEETSVG
mmetsp:Transcript_1979/g.3981  ORF Transcript_1979/g.3981 Transcript_1979/m.3981 type:complete len:498 (-) Transcript_1979:37-1530(-)